MLKQRQTHIQKVFNQQKDFKAFIKEFNNLYYREKIIKYVQNHLKQATAIELEFMDVVVNKKHVSFQNVDERKC